MTGEAYELELQKRGFVFDAQRNQWHGPFGLTVTGALNATPDDSSHRWSLREVDHAYARVDVLRLLDERLRARRGLTRPPLVKPANPYSPNYEPYKQIPPPRA